MWKTGEGQHLLTSALNNQNVYFLIVLTSALNKQNAPFYITVATPEPARSYGYLLLHGEIESGQ